jgi:hypothetical protein
VRRKRSVVHNSSFVRIAEAIADEQSHLVMGVILAIGQRTAVEFNYFAHTGYN